MAYLGAYACGEGLSIGRRIIKFERAKLMVCVLSVNIFCDKAAEYKRLKQ